MRGRLEDFQVSAAMEQYFANFIKTGNPNREAAFRSGSARQIAAMRFQFLQIDVNTSGRGGTSRRSIRGAGQTREIRSNNALRKATKWLVKRI